MTPPKPYSEAVFMAASSEPAIAVLLPSAKRSRIDANASTTPVRMPSTKAPSTAHTATTDDTCVVTGFANPGSSVVCVVP